MQPLPYVRQPDEETLRWGAKEVSDFYSYIRMSVNQDIRISFGGDLLASVEEMVKSYSDESVHYEMAFLLPAWKYLENLVSRIQAAYKKYVQKDGCIIHMDGIENDPALDWVKNEKELQAIMTEVEVGVMRKQNRQLTKNEAAVMVALRPILVLEKF